MSMSGRVAYRDELTRLAATDDRIVCLEADLGGHAHPFQSAHPLRFMNVGIAELAGLDLAAGMAAQGLVPFFSTFAPFTLRAAEGIKLNMGYMGLNIKLVAPYSGVSGGWFGPTHHSLEDIALVQSIPGITIAAPFGERETRDVIARAAAAEGPFYIRLGRNGAYESLASDERAQRTNVVWQAAPAQARLCLVSTGEQATQLAISLCRERTDLAHAHLCYLDASSLSHAVTEIVSKYNAFLVIEEHRPWGGVASSLALRMPQAYVAVHSCGEGWPHLGGDHDAVLAEMGFGQREATAQVEHILQTMSL